MNKAKAQRGQLETEREKIVSDQERIRSNLQSVGQSSDLGRRYLDDAENAGRPARRIEKLDAALEKEIEAKTKAAEDVVRQLTL